jgi:hypothetical protein
LWVPTGDRPPRPSTASSSCTDVTEELQCSGGVAPAPATGEAAPGPDRGSPRRVVVSLPPAVLRERAANGASPAPRTAGTKGNSSWVGMRGSSACFDILFASAFLLPPLCPSVCRGVFDGQAMQQSRTDQLVPTSRAPSTPATKPARWTPRKSHHRHDVHVSLPAPACRRPHRRLGSSPACPARVARTTCLGARTACPCPTAHPWPRATAPHPLRRGRARHCLVAQAVRPQRRRARTRPYCRPVHGSAWGRRGIGSAPPPWAGACWTGARMRDVEQPVLQKCAF